MELRVIVIAGVCYVLLALLSAVSIRSQSWSGGIFGYHIPRALDWSRLVAPIFIFFVVEQAGFSWGGLHAQNLRAEVLFAASVVLAFHIGYCAFSFWFYSKVFHAKVGENKKLLFYSLRIFGILFAFAAMLLVASILSPYTLVIGFLVIFFGRFAVQKTLPEMPDSPLRDELAAIYRNSGVGSAKFKISILTPSFPPGHSLARAIRWSNIPVQLRKCEILPVDFLQSADSGTLTAVTTYSLSRRKLRGGVFQFVLGCMAVWLLASMFSAFAELSIFELVGFLPWLALTALVHCAAGDFGFYLFGVELLAHAWAAWISADEHDDQRSPEDFLQHLQKWDTLRTNSDNDVRLAQKYENSKLFREFLPRIRSEEPVEAGLPQ